MTRTRYRSASSSHTTQDSLPVGGQPLPGGIGYPPGFIEGFTSRHDDPNLPGFSWRNQGTKVTDSPSERLKPAPPAAGSRYQHWKL